MDFSSAAAVSYMLLLEEVNSGWSELGHMRPRGDINSKKEKRNMYRVSFSDSVLPSFLLLAL